MGASTWTAAHAGPLSSVSFTPQDKAGITDHLDGNQAIDQARDPFEGFTETIDDDFDIVNSLYVGPGDLADQRAKKKMKDIEKQMFQLQVRHGEIWDDIGREGKKLLTLNLILARQQDFYDGAKGSYEYYKREFGPNDESTIENKKRFEEYRDERAEDLKRRRDINATVKAMRDEVAEIEKKLEKLGKELTQEASKVKSLNALEKTAYGVGAPIIGGPSTGFTQSSADPLAALGPLISGYQQTLAAASDTSRPLIAPGLFNFSTRSVIANNTRLGGWLKGATGGSESTQAGADHDASFWSLAGGLTYIVNDKVRLGASVKFQKTDRASTAFKTKGDTESFGGALTADINLPQALNLHLLTSVEGSKSDVSINTFTGSYNSTAWTVAAKLTRPVLFSTGIWLKPLAGISWRKIDRDTYVNSANRTITGTKNDIGVVRTGARAGKRFLVSATAAEGGLRHISPSLGLEAFWLIARPKDTVLTNGTVLATAERGLAIDGKVAFAFHGGGTTNLRAAISLMNKGQHAWSLSGGHTMPLRTLTGDDRDSGATLAFSAASSQKELLVSRVRFSFPF